MESKTKSMTTIAMLAAMAFIMVIFIRIPIVLFLEYEPKDVIITLGGFIWGPMTSFIVSVIVSLIEMVTISEDGILGLVMNILSTGRLYCRAGVFRNEKNLFTITHGY